MTQVVDLQDDSMSLSYSAVRAILTSTGEPLSQEDVAEFFRIVDEDQDGMLHVLELMKVQHKCWWTFT
jgi:Ca2+-binding EF-hand superfamily protein